VLSACDELVRLSPTKFDPSVVQALLVHLRRDLDGKSSARLLPQQKSAQISSEQLEKMSFELVGQLTGNRVYSA
jgi:hypothetical protein